MKHHGLFAFALTTAVLVPAAANYLTAGHDQVARFAAGNSGELQLGGATIQTKLEHPLVDPGEPLKIKLTASGAKGKRLEVGLLVYGSSGDEGSRVPSPPRGVAYRTVTIPVDAEGTGATEIAIPLKGAANNDYYPQAFTSYEVLVMAPKAAEKLERLRRNAGFVGDQEGIPEYNKSGERFMSLYRWGGEKTGEDATLFAEGAVVRLDAHTRAINPSIAITTPDTTEIGKGFAVTIAVTNSTKKPVKGMELSLETPLGVVEDVVEDDGKATGISALVMPEQIDFELGAGETKRFDFRVMPSDLGVLGLYARVACHGEECPEKHPLTRSGTFDATEIVKATVVEAPAPIVGSK
jgi:hypothetical protein